MEQPKTSTWPAPTPRKPLGAKQLRTRAMSLVVLSIMLFLLLGSYWLPSSLARGKADLRYLQYTIPLLVPVTAWFVIANWVGWQYFRYA